MTVEEYAEKIEDIYGDFATVESVYVDDGVVKGTVLWSMPDLEHPANDELVYTSKDMRFDYRFEDGEIEPDLDAVYDVARALWVDDVELDDRQRPEKVKRYAVGEI